MPNKFFVELDVEEADFIIASMMAAVAPMTSTDRRQLCIITGNAAVKSALVSLGEEGADKLCDKLISLAKQAKS